MPDDDPPVPDSGAATYSLPPRPEPVNFTTGPLGGQFRTQNSRCTLLTTPLAKTPFLASEPRPTS